MRVFISSTCYDLIDLRAELEAFFRDAGVTPILSDSPNSEFELLPDKNSIETCLANVRASDAFVIILSNRYGPRLGKEGFEDVSATHLEYLEAMNSGKPIYMYVRDKLEGECSIWRKNPHEGLKLSWCKKNEDWGIFELLEAYRKLQGEKPQSNWIWTFRSSVELKQRLAIDFKEAFARVTATKLFENGRLPFFEIEPRFTEFGHDHIKFALKVRNISNVMAVYPVIEVGPKSPANTRPLPSLGGQQQCEAKWEWAYQRGNQMELPFSLPFSILQGHDFKDVGSLQFVPVFQTVPTQSTTALFLTSLIGASI